MAKSQKSVSHARMVWGYLNPKYHAIYEAYKDVNEMGISEALNVIVRDFFDRMPAHEKKQLIEKRQSKNSY